MHHVFVSYSRTDGEWVRELVKRLEQQRIDVWIDQEDIPVTVPWLTEVKDAIEDAALFLRCDSEAFRVSGSCTAEVAFAEQGSKPQFAVPVGASIDRCAASIQQTLTEIGPGRRRRTELRVLSRDWDRSGRPRNLLVGRVHRLRLASGLKLPPDATEAEQAFLRASQARTRVRALIASVLVLVIGASGLSIAVLREAQNIVNTDNSNVAVAENQSQAGLSRVAQDPYGGLQAAAGAGGNESATNAAVITQALMNPVPDDAFRVSDADRFAVRPVGAEVLVATTSGQEWQHPSASADAAQAATKLRTGDALLAGRASAGTDVTASGAEGLTASASPGSGMVRVYRQGRLWRTIDFDAVAGALAFSPDGRFIAATTGTEVEVADIAEAQVRLQLRGATGDLLDVAWSVDGASVWALDDARVFSWRLGNAVTLADDPGESFNSVLPATGPGDAWIIGKHALTEISVSTGKTLHVITLPDTLSTAGATPDGSLALVSGARYLWVVPLSGTGQPRHVTLRGCSLGRPSLASDSVGYVPCIGGSVLRLSLPSASVTATIAVPNKGFGVTAVPGTSTVFVGDEAGYVNIVDGDAADPIEALECDPEIEHIGVAPGGKAVLPVGTGTGQGTCTTIGLLRANGNPASPASWTWNHSLDSQQQSVTASAVAFSAHGGSFAIGYTNGTVVVQPTQNLVPALVDNTADGIIRSMLALPDGYLIDVTSTGMVQRLPLCDSCISNAALAKVAAGRLTLTEHLGLAVAVRR